MRKHTKEETMALLQGAARKWVDNWRRSPEEKELYQQALITITWAITPDEILDTVFEDLLEENAERMAQFVMEALTETETKE